MDGRQEAQAMEPVVGAALLDGVFVSPVSAWEIGRLSRRAQPAAQFLPNPKTWFAAAAARTTIKIADLTPDIAIESSFLPGTFHRDPDDRRVVATARQHGMSVGTSDRKIIDYAAAGFVTVIPC